MKVLQTNTGETTVEMMIGIRTTSNPVQTDHSITMAGLIPRSRINQLTISKSRDPKMTEGATNVVSTVTLLENAKMKMRGITSTSQNHRLVSSTQTSLMIIKIVTMIQIRIILRNRGSLMVTRDRRNIRNLKKLVHTDLIPRPLRKRRNPKTRQKIVTSMT